MADMVNPLGAGGVGGLSGPGGPAGPGAVAPSPDGKSFKDILTDQIGKVNSLQEEANVAADKLLSGESNNVEEVLLAAKKAELAFKTMMQVRNKIMDAYEELMRMRI